MGTADSANFTSAGVGKQDVVLRQEYKAGEKLFVDWAGPTIPIYSRTGGPTEEAHLFVAVLGASSYTYAESTRDEQMINWLTVHMRAFEFFGGVTKLIVPDTGDVSASFVWRRSTPPNGPKRQRSGLC
jgi:transposase